MLEHADFSTPRRKRAQSPDEEIGAMTKMRKFGLSPVIEEFSNIMLTSSKKRPRDDIHIEREKLPMADLFPRFKNEESKNSEQSTQKV